MNNKIPNTNLSNKLPRLFSAPRCLGTVSTISASFAKVNLSKAGLPSGSSFGGGRYGLGEVSEFVLIEGERASVFGRITEVRLPERERLSVEDEAGVGVEVHALAFVQLLASVSLETLKVISGIEIYPRLGDKVYAAPHSFIAQIPELMAIKSDGETTANRVVLRLGHIKNAPETSISIRPEKLFGRHCAILGATGGGKSYTLARIVEECQKHQCKAILLDATGEYRDLAGSIEHWHLGIPFETAIGSEEASVPPTSFLEQDFIALFEPSGKVQGPKLRAAIRSLKLAEICPNEATNGLIKKKGKTQKEIGRIEFKNSEALENPKNAFNPHNLANQIVEECVRYNGDAAGIDDDFNFNFCLPLITRISGILRSEALGPVFQSKGKPIDEVIHEFEKGEAKILRFCMSGLMTDFNAKEVITNAIGRNLLSRARAGDFRDRPMVVFLDEAHAFIGKAFGSEDFHTRLDAFEIIAKEGRKYGLNLCLATQRPRDLPEGVISQMGTLIVHRLTNDKDREMVERACGEIDRSASSFLPNLQPGEAALLGVDFPIPMTIQIAMPVAKPQSDGSDFQKNWNDPLKSAE